MESKPIDSKLEQLLWRLEHTAPADSNYQDLCELALKRALSKPATSFFLFAYLCDTDRRFTRIDYTSSELRLHAARVLYTSIQSHGTTVRVSDPTGERPETALNVWEMCKFHVVRCPYPDDSAADCKLISECNALIDSALATYLQSTLFDEEADQLARRNWELFPRCYEALQSSDFRGIQRIIPLIQARIHDIQFRNSLDQKMSEYLGSAADVRSEDISTPDVLQKFEFRTRGKLLAAFKTEVGGQFGREIRRLESEFNQAQILTKNLTRVSDVLGELVCWPASLLAAYLLYGYYSPTETVWYALLYSVCGWAASLLLARFLPPIFASLLSEWRLSARRTRRDQKIAGYRRFMIDA